jgi:hypothetical protein
MAEAMNQLGEQLRPILANETEPPPPARRAAKERLAL